jgi:hypothetical protein
VQPFALTAQETEQGRGESPGQLRGRIQRLLHAEARYSLRRFKDDQPTRAAYEAVRAERLRCEDELERVEIENPTPENQEALF